MPRPQGDVLRGWGSSPFVICFYCEGYRIESPHWHFFSKLLAQIWGVLYLFASSLNSHFDIEKVGPFTIYPK